MRVAFIGLGKMGNQIVSKLIDDGHELIVYDVDSAAVATCAEMGAKPASSLEMLVELAGPKPVVWMMIPAQFVEQTFTLLSSLLPAGAILVDGGNSNYHDTIRRAEACTKKDISYVDVGTSGGILGLSNGFCLMTGGDKTTDAHLQPIYKTLTWPSGKYAYMGPSGSGHYVKMVHNGIEYALMQAYAEGYDLLKYGPVQNIPLATVADVWQGGSIVASKLNGLIAEMFSEDTEFASIEGTVPDSGEGAWTLEVAEAAQVPMPALREALNVRHTSQNGYHTFATKLLAVLRNKFGGHPIPKK